MFLKFLVLIFFKTLICDFEEFCKKEKNHPKEMFTKKSEDMQGEEIVLGFFDALNNLDNKIIENNLKNLSFNKWIPNSNFGGIYGFLSLLKENEKKEKFLENAEKALNGYENFIKKFFYSNKLYLEKDFFVKDGEIFYERIGSMLYMTLINDSGSEGNFFAKLRERNPFGNYKSISSDELYKIFTKENKERDKLLEEISYIFESEFRINAHLKMDSIKKQIEDKEKALNFYLYKTDQNGYYHITFNDLLSRCYLIETILVYSKFDSNFELKIEKENEKNLIRIFSLLTGNIYSEKKISDYINGFKSFLIEKKYKYSVFGTNSGSANTEFFTLFKRYLNEKDIESLKVAPWTINLINYLIKKDSYGINSDFNEVLRKIFYHIDTKLVDDQINYSCREEEIEA